MNIVETPSDMDLAHEAFGACCGHGAFAAATNRLVLDSLEFFQPDPSDENRVNPWVNIPQMAGALFKARAPFTRSPKGQWPVNGIAGIQFLGPWMSFARAACTKRHFVAVREKHGMQVWDCNLGDWLPFEDWERWAIADLLPKRSTGYSVLCGFEIQPKK